MTSNTTTTAKTGYWPSSPVVQVYLNMVLILSVYLTLFFAYNETLVFQTRGLALWPGRELNMKYKSHFDQSYIVDSRKINVKANNTNYCDYVYIDEESDIPKTYLDLHSARFSINSSLYRISNILVTPMPILGTMNNNAYIFNASNKDLSVYFRKGKLRKFIFRYTANFHFQKKIDCVVHTGCPWINIYGHFFWDLLNPLLLVPNDILSRCTLFVPKLFKNFAISALGIIFGISETQIIFFNNAYADMIKWYFVKDLYLFDGKYEYENYQTLSSTLIKLAKEKFNISKLTPYRYFLHNREAFYGKRVISNFVDLCNAAKKTFPNISWECINPKTKNFRENIQFYHEVIFYFTPTGSDVFYALFMQPNTVVVDAMSAEFNCNDVSVCYSSNVSLIVFRWPDLLKHHFEGAFPIPSDIFLKNIRFGLNVLNNERFREEHRKFKGKSKCWS